MRKFSKPIVIVSRCIEFEPVRWNAQIISSDFVKKLTPYVNFIPVCPEVEIGLGIPRDPLRIVSVNGGLRLVQPATDLDFTEKMRSFTKSFLDSIPEVDGFILKRGSPTSALRDARIYPSGKKVAPIARGPGFFGKAVLGNFSHLAIEDEGRLRNPRIKEHFLRKLFTLARFRVVKSSGSSSELAGFHSGNILLLTAYDQSKLKILGRLNANQENKAFPELVEEYAKHLFAALKRPPTCESNINVIVKSMGYFSKRLSKDEKSFFLDSIEKYRNGTIPLSVIIGILNAWVIRFEEDYLMNQTFFAPYPRELADIDVMTTYCNGKDYWK